MALTYFLLLPSLTSFKPTSLFSSETPYAALPTLDDDTTSDTSSLLEDDQAMQRVERQLEKLPGLTTKEKFELARPLFARFMLPLFFVYLAGESIAQFSCCIPLTAAVVFAEYTINSGVAPTLLYEIPNRQDSPILASMIKNLRDYYP
jgi:battenin